jgi:hypothetical protein
MRHFLSKLVVAVFVVGLALGLSQANATPLPLLNGLASQASRSRRPTITGIATAATDTVTTRVTTTGAPTITGPTITAMATGRTATGIGPTTIAVTGSRQTQDQDRTALTGPDTSSPDGTATRG